MAVKVPQLVAGVDFQKLKLDPMDGFVLSRINGKLGLADLARETGLPDFSVARALEKLEKLGVIAQVDPSAPPPAAPPPAAPRRASTTEFNEGLLAPKYDPKELDEVADLPPEMKKRILDLYYRLEDLDHYTLLGLSKETDKKAVKRAYFELAAAFHPDRFFKKNLGSFKPKMEIVFARVTEAHDTLVDATKRADYDAYLTEVASTRGMESLFERALMETRMETRTETRIEGRTSVPAPPPGPAPIPTAPPPSAPSAEDIRRRREALARRLTGGKTAPTGGTPSTLPPEKPAGLQFASSAEAVESLKRRYETRIEQAAEANTHRYMTAAEHALERKDLAAAATALGMASQLSPDDTALSERAQEARRLADATLSESYLKQAQYEEKQQLWPEASRSWVKVAKIKNDAVSNERAAHALLRAPEGDLHLAAEHAKLAISQDPKNIDNHITLVEIFLKAGLTVSARRAAESASQLDAKHIGLLALMKRIGKG